MSNVAFIRPHLSQRADRTNALWKVTMKPFSITLFVIAGDPVCIGRISRAIF
jgi:hypothetical protein